MFLPVLINSKENELVYFGENPIYKNWNNYKESSHLLNYILPAEDIEDMKIFNNNIESIEEYNFEKIVKKINDTDKSIDEIKKILLQKDTDTKNANYKEDIENLIKLNEELQKQVDKLTLNLKNIDNEVNTDSRSIESRQIPTLIKLIFIKYENGGSVRNEILLLEDLLKPNKEEIFEKISLLELKKFYGFKNLEKIFDDLAREFVKTKFAKNNQNYVINFLLKFVSIQPSNLTIYENEDLNILMRAKKNLEIRNIQQSLDQILLIKENDMFFTEWVEQVKIYLEFKSLIEKVS